MNHPNQENFHFGALCYGIASGVVHPPSKSPVECAPAIAMVLFFRYASVPMMEQRSLAKRPGYAHLMSRVPSPLLLWPPPPPPPPPLPPRIASAPVKNAGRLRQTD